MTLRQKQSIFVKCVAELIDFAYKNGYELTFGEAYRSVEEAIRLGKKKTLHTKRLAIDLNLFKDGKYLMKSEDHLELGMFWESLSFNESFVTYWGGRFNDGNHYSIGHGGMK